MYESDLGGGTFTQFTVFQGPAAYVTAIGPGGIPDAATLFTSYQDTSQVTTSNSLLRVIGRKDKGFGAFYVQNTTGTWGAVLRDGTTPTPAGGTVTLLNMNAGGSYTVQWFDTNTGALLHTDTDVANGSGQLTTTLPQTITDSIAAIVTGATPPTATPAPTATATATPTATPAATATSTPSSDNDVLDINAGGSAASPFVADEDFSGGATGSITATVDTSKASDPAPEAVYQTRRAGTGTGCNCFTYTIPGLTPGAGYTVRLHFNEHAKKASGQREFDVSINGSQVLTNFDIYAAAGGQDIAISEAFATTADSNGDITISFTPGAIDNPLVNGIEIEAGSSATPTPTATPAATATPIATNTPTPGPTATPTATSTPSSDNDVLDINAGGSAAAPFVADEDFSGGAANSITATVDTSKASDPAPQAVYQTRRNGTGTGCNCFTYTIPGLTPGGNYTVRLQFNEHAKTGSGQREFDVSINGTQVLTNFDIFAAAGGQDIAVSEAFATTADTSGTITINFNPGAIDNPLVNGIEIEQ